MCTGDAVVKSEILKEEKKGHIHQKKKTKVFSYLSSGKRGAQNSHGLSSALLASVGEVSSEKTEDRSSQSHFSSLKTKQKQNKTNKTKQKQNP